MEDQTHLISIIALPSIWLLLTAGSSWPVTMEVAAPVSQRHHKSVRTIGQTCLWHLWLYRDSNLYFDTISGHLNTSIYHIQNHKKYKPIAIGNATGFEMTIYVIGVGKGLAWFSEIRFSEGKSVCAIKFLKLFVKFPFNSARYFGRPGYKFSRHTCTSCRQVGRDTVSREWSQ